MPVRFCRHHRGVITTYRPNGAMHASIVVCGAYQGNAAFVIVRGTSVKARHLRRDPAVRCWRSPKIGAVVSVEGEAQLFDARNTEAEQLRRMLRVLPRPVTRITRIGRSTTGPCAQDAVIVLVRPQRVYGLVR